MRKASKATLALALAFALLFPGSSAAVAEGGAEVLADSDHCCDVFVELYDSSDWDVVPVSIDERAPDDDACTHDSVVRYITYNGGWYPVSSSRCARDFIAETQCRDCGYTYTSTGTETGSHVFGSYSDGGHTGSTNRWTQYCDYCGYSKTSVVSCGGPPCYYWGSPTP